MVNVDIGPRVGAQGVQVCSENQFQDETKKPIHDAKESVDRSSRSSPPSDDRKEMAYNMLRDKFKSKSQKDFSYKEKVREKAARRVGYDPKRYSRPFEGRSRDFRAIITAVKFKQYMLKALSPKRDLLKEAILTNTRKRAEDELFIRGRQRQLQRAQAVAEAKAKEANSRSDEKPVTEFEDDEVIRSLWEFMDSISNVTR